MYKRNLIIFLMSKVFFTLLVTSCTISVGSSISSSSSSTASTSSISLTVIGTEWKLLGFYSNNVLIGSYITTNENGDVYFYVYKFSEKMVVMDEYSNNIKIDSFTRHDVYVTENLLISSNEKFSLDGKLYYGTFIYTNSLTGNNFKMIIYSFEGTNESGVLLSTNFYNSGSYFYYYFEKF